MTELSLGDEYEEGIVIAISSTYNRHHRVIMVFNKTYPHYTVAVVGVDNPGSIILRQEGSTLGEAAELYHRRIETDY